MRSRSGLGIGSSRFAVVIQNTFERSKETFR
jgi:hypothetical protein